MEIKKITSTLLASNTYILIKDNSSIIIDSGAKLEDVIKTTQGTKVEGIFLTHGHYDHSFNSIKYSKNFNCKIFASKEIAETLSNPSKNYGDDFKINNFEDFIFFDKEGTINTPNFEIKTLFYEIVRDWFKDKVVGNDLRSILKDLVELNISEFEKKFRILVREMFSYMDVDSFVSHLK